MTIANPDIIWSEEEKEAIAFALIQTECHPWEVDKMTCSKEIKQNLKEVKRKIRAFHLMTQNNACCYCKLPLQNAGDFMVDREHILPKGLIPEYSYATWNLSVSCKRCNMTYKKEKTDFVVSFETIKGDPQNSARYTIVHPNLDRWEDHLSRYVYSPGQHILMIFSARDGKGKNTKDFFNLTGLEVNIFDTAQGKENANPQDVEIVEMLLKRSQEFMTPLS